MDLLAHHLAKADGGAADAEIHQLGDGIEFQFVKEDPG
jgi:hypothetical protein